MSAQQVNIIDIAEPMQDRPKKDGSGTYRAMKVTVKLPDGELKTILSFDEHVTGDVVSVEKNDAGYWNIVKPSRGYDKPAAPGNTDVMQSIRMLYTLTAQIAKNVEAIMKDVGIPQVVETSGQHDLTNAVNAAVMDKPPVDDSGIAKFRQARQQTGLVKEEGIPQELLDDPDYDAPFDINQIPF